MGIESNFDISFIAEQALREKQIQQNYRPVIGVHKWFARRPGTLFRGLLLSEFSLGATLAEAFFKGHNFNGIIGDPFMGGGTPIIEANRLGFGVIGTDINPMAFWIVRQELDDINLKVLKETALALIKDINKKTQAFYTTSCDFCNKKAEIKYFLWVKTQECPSCHTENELFPGYLLAEDVRHPKNVITCGHCLKLNEYADIPTRESPDICLHCGEEVTVEGPAKRNKINCKKCHYQFKYPETEAPPKHKLWAMEYYCSECKPLHQGRFFKSVTIDDVSKYEAAAKALDNCITELPIPKTKIPEGDETKRLHRWGYKHFHEMFNKRQLYSLGLLLNAIIKVEDTPTKNALCTVFSDMLRYQNMLCRYDSYALKCQDIFSVHGFPVGLVQCENNVLGIPKVGSGSFIHFVEKYIRAKEYCQHPFEKEKRGAKTHLIPIVGENINAQFVQSSLPTSKEANIKCVSGSEIQLQPNSLDGVFTDPPYFANVQYAELMDFCYVWLREGLKDDFSIFKLQTTRSPQELTGNIFMGRDLQHFAEGLSKVFQNYTNALKPEAPFVFTYHHNELEAYAPLVLAILDAGLFCTSVIPAPAEMGASLHINNTASSIIDSVFISRKVWPDIPSLPTKSDLYALIKQECDALKNGGVKLTKGDLKCIVSGHFSRLAIQSLRLSWDKHQKISTRLEKVFDKLKSIFEAYNDDKHLVALLTPEKTLVGLGN